MHALLLLACLLPGLVRPEPLPRGALDTRVPAQEVPPVVESIRAELARAATNTAGERPLPLASHWARSFGGANFSSDYQVGLLETGHHVLPNLPMPAPGGRPYPPAGLALLRKLAAWGAPFSLRVDQWENLLLSKDHPTDVPGKWRTLPPEQSPLVLAPDGTIRPMISPFGSVEPWYEVGYYYSHSAAFVQLQDAYPNPPLVVLLSNNEARRLEAKNDVRHLSRRFIDAYGAHASDAAVRGAMADGYVERYAALFDGVRDGLVRDAWKRHAIIVGYGAFGPAHFGRWPGWTAYSLATNGRIDPWPLAWDGGSVPYYTHDWDASTDYTLHSPQVEAMNWVFMLDEANRVNPDFWFELSVWDGNSGPRKPGARNVDKAEVYRRRGQTWSPERYAGFVQFGMWLTTPRVVREFRGHGVPRTRFQAEYEALVAAVDRVWEDPVLERFWRRSRLVPNRSRTHPYQSNIPPKWQRVDRWFLLTTTPGPTAFPSLETEIPVFALARVLGDPGRREWLLYAHAPVHAYTGVAVDLPDFGSVTIDVPPAGVFYLVREHDRSVTRVAVP